MSHTDAPPPLSPRLAAIRRAVANSDFSVLRDGGEELVFAYAAAVGMTPPELMRCWQREGEAATSTAARKTTVDIKPDRTVIVVDDDPPADQQTEPDDKPDDDEQEADDYSDDDVRDDPPPSKPKPGGKKSGDDCDPDDDPNCDD
jgi:hypothetical protein